MTATDELRRMLDERDEYYKTSGNRTWWGRPTDARTGEPINVFHNQAQPMGEDRLFVELQLATPEQAIEATLGRGECRDVCNGTTEFICSACGFDCDLTSWISLFDGDEGRRLHHHYGAPRYCPNCGRKVVDDASVD